MEVRWDTYSRSTCSACACAYARGAWPVHGATMACINGVHAVHVHASVQHVVHVHGACGPRLDGLRSFCSASRCSFCSWWNWPSSPPSNARPPSLEPRYSSPRLALPTAFPSAGFMAYPYGATSRPPVCGAAISPPRLQALPARRRLAPCACCCVLTNFSWLGLRRWLSGGGIIIASQVVPRW